jgi:hypothetical protein
MQDLLAEALNRYATCSVKHTVAVCMADLDARAAAAIMLVPVLPRSGFVAYRVDLKDGVSGLQYSGNCSEQKHEFT